MGQERGDSLDTHFGFGCLDFYLSSPGHLGSLA